MSAQNFREGIFSFSNGYDRSNMTKHMVRGQVFEQLVPVQAQEEVSCHLQMYETGGMLSEMFNFGLGQTAATGVLDSQIPSDYRWSQKLQPSAAANEAELGVLGEEQNLNPDDCNYIGRNHQFLNINNAHLANSMQLSTMNSHVKAFSSPAPSSSALQMIFSNPSDSHVRGFHLNSPAAIAGAGLGGSENTPVQFTWLPGSSGEDDVADKIVGAVDRQGLSLSLSSSLQHLEAAKFEELRVGSDGVFFSNQGVGASFNPYGSTKTLGIDRQPLHSEAILDRHGQVHVGSGTSVEMVNVLRNSKYVKPAQELLEELCCIGRGQFKIHRPKKLHLNPNSNTNTGCGVGSSSSKEHPSLSAADKTEYQRKKVKLLSMLDEVEARYRRYCEKMQTMVNAFDSVMGFGAAMTYTALAQKAMSRHFRCIKNGIAKQLKLTCELLGEKDVIGISGLTRGETPRLRLLEQSFRHQKGLHHMGMMELEAWRSQRGLPERSLNTLRAWLFEHFLHPYPSDADKHLLSRQTGLSKNQVSNWFINARVRLWKPMVEEMYQQEAEEEQQAAAQEEAKSCEQPDSEEGHPNTMSAQTPMHSTTKTTTKTTTLPSAAVAATPPVKRSETNETEKDASQNSINYRQYSSGNQVMFQGHANPTTTTTSTSSSSATACHDVSPTVFHCLRNWGTAVDDMGVVEFGNISTAGANLASSLVNLGTPAGDVSLTLGLRHTGNVPEKSQLQVRNFGAF